MNADNTCELHTKGYTTATTKDRLNGFSPARVIQKDFTFYVLRGPTQRVLKSNLVPFFEVIPEPVDMRDNNNAIDTDSYRRNGWFQKIL